MFMVRPSIQRVISVVVLCGLIAILFLTSPRSEDFWWTDAASFALNGELIHDYVASGFHQSPMAFANEWFRYYPAVTISLYPPLFPMSEAIAFSLFGFSHPVAQATVAAFAGLAAYGAYRLARTVTGPLEAAGGVMLIFSAPGILLWSRQVMMEVPSLAFLLLASFYLVRFQDGRRSRDLIVATVSTVFAVYTKQTAIFAAPAFAIALIVSDGWHLLRNRTAWTAAAIGIVALVPLAVFTLVMAPETLSIAFNQGIAVQAGNAVQAGGHLAQAEAYILTLPDIIGWPILIAAVCYLAGVAWLGWRSQDERRLAVLMLAWFGCDFIFVSMTGHFEARYAMALGVPSALFSLLLLSRIFPASVQPFAILAAGVGALAFFIWTRPVSRMSGYDKVAAYVLQHSAQNDVVWFQGNESKNFAFSLRSHQPTPKLFVLRAEKYLTDYHIEREWGITDRGWTANALQAMADRRHISMVVLQPGFWTDLPSMKRMQDYILSDHFRKVAEFKITADEPSQRSTIEIFVKQRPADTTESSD